jgi:hypothetical protein
MATPRMFVIAGPPGAGKSSVFSLSKFAERTFNADDRAAELNSGSYQDIPLSIRAIVNREFEEFVRANIRSGNSFALETTLRSSITFDQARLAKENGFRVIMRYVALETPEPTSSGCCSALPAPGMRPVKQPYDEFTRIVFETCQPLLFQPKAVSSRCAFMTTLGLGNLRGLFCK